MKLSFALLASLGCAACAADPAPRWAPPPLPTPLASVPETSAVAPPPAAPSFERPPYAPSHACAAPPAPDLRARMAMQLGHDGEVQAIALSPDGRVLASGDDAGKILLWDPDDARERATLGDPALGKIVGLAFAGDGELVAVGGQGRVVVWDLARDAVRIAFDTKRAARKLELSPSGALAAIVPALWTRGPVTIWDLATGTRRGELAADDVYGWSPDGAKLAIRRPRELAIWDVEKNALDLRVRETRSARFAAFSRDGSAIAVSELAPKPAVFVHDAKSGALRETIEVEGTPVGLKWLTPGARLAVAIHEVGVDIRDFGAGRTSRIDAPWLRAYWLSDDGSSLVTPFARGRGLCVHEKNKKDKCGEQDTDAVDPAQILRTPSGKAIATVTPHASAPRIWRGDLAYESPSGRLRAVLPHLERTPFALTFLADGSKLVVSDLVHNIFFGFATVELVAHDLVGGGARPFPSPLLGEIRGIDASPDGAWFGVEDGMGTVSLRGLGKTHPVRDLWPRDFADAHAWSPRGELAAYEARAGRIAILQPGTGKTVSFAAPTQATGGARLAFSPDGGALALAHSGAIWIFAAPGFGAPRELRGPPGQPLGLVWLDARTVAAATLASVDRVDVGTGIATPIDIAGGAKLALSADGAWLAVADPLRDSYTNRGGRGEVRVWDLARGALVARRGGYGEDLHDIAFYPRGRGPHERILAIAGHGVELFRPSDGASIELERTFDWHSHPFAAGLARSARGAYSGDPALTGRARMRTGVDVRSALTAPPPQMAQPDLVAQLLGGCPME